MENIEIRSDEWSWIEIENKEARSIDAKVIQI